MHRTVRSVASLAVGAALLAGCSIGSTPVPIRQSVDVSAFVPTAKNQDPSKKITGIVTAKFPSGQHVPGNVRVAYTHTPPMGGTHDQAWAACNGVVYPKPVRSENLVHSMEHGAVWIAYDPDKITGTDVTTLASLVEGKPYTVMSPYPGMPSPISLQSWGHQLALDSVADPRIDQFIAALRQNQYVYPEPGASCAEVGQPYFVQDSPPAFVATPAQSEINGKTIVKEK